MNRSRRIFLMLLGISLTSVFSYADIGSDSGNLYNYRNGDATYREMDFSGLEFYNHVGLVAAVSSSGDNASTLYEMTTEEFHLTGIGSIALRTMETHKTTASWFGCYTVQGDLTDTERQQIVNTATTLYNRGNVAYTWADMLDPFSFSGDYIDPTEVQQLRCDGLVEYCYEWNNVWVWGRTDTGNANGTPTNFDISRNESAYLGAHNNLDQGANDPWYSTSPRGQRGGNFSGYQFNGESPYTKMRPADDYYEQNDTQSAAHDLSDRPDQWLYFGRAYQFDDDWYRIRVASSSNRRVYIQCNFTHSKGDIDIQLLDSSGNVLASSTSSSDDENIDQIVPSTGYYYIRAYFDNDGNSYNIYWNTYSSPTPPSKATSPSPSNGATGQSINTDVSWSNGGGATSYDVYFGTDSTPDSGEYKGNQSGTSYDPGTLAYSTTYYWRIDAKNSAGTTTGDVWSFTTGSAPPQPPSKATSPNPSNGATGQSINTDVSWSNGGGATSYDVYFGTDSTPDSGEYKGNQSGTSYDPGTLAYSTTYYWRIDAKNSAGTTMGDVWSFTTGSAPPQPPSKATNPSPSNSATGQSINTDVSWSNGGGATSYDVYFGTDSIPDSGEYKGNQSGTSYDPGTLAYSTTYYWRIDAKNSAGTTTGDVWSFTTEVAQNNPPNTPDLSSPANNATGQSLTPVLQASSFSDPDPSDTHANSQWQVWSTSNEELDQAQTGVNYGFWFEEGIERWQEFLPEISDCARLEVCLVRNGNPGDIDISITDNADNPIWNRRIAQTEVSRGQSWLSVAIQPPLHLTPESIYRIRIVGVSGSPNAENRYFWTGHTDSSYIRGSSSVASGWPTYDFAFQTYTVGTDAIWDSGQSFAASTQTTVPSGYLRYDTTYYWHVRYRDNHGSWSSWSSSWHFTTNTPSPTWTPTNTPTETPTQTLTPSNTPTVTPTDTSTATETFTPTITDTPTATETYTPTNTDTPTVSETSTPIFSDTPTATETYTPTPTETADLRADINGDGNINEMDVLELSSVWMASTKIGSSTPDVDEDGMVGPKDLLLVLENWQKGVLSPTQTETETSTPTPSEAPTSTETASPTETPSDTSIVTVTPTWTISQTPTYSETETPTPSPSSKVTLTPTLNSSATFTPTLTHTPTPTGTDTETPTPTPTDTLSPTPTPSEFIVPLTLPEGARSLKLIRIPAGSFVMGSTTTTPEEPTHTVTLNYDYFIGETEITEAQWASVMNEAQGTTPEYPKVAVSWNDVQTFLISLNAMPGGGGFRLPSEAEWEYACRAGSQTRFFFGDSLGCDDMCQNCAAEVLGGNQSDYMQYCGSTNPSGRTDVGSLLENPFGLYDVHGNVWEWCQDRYHDNYIGAPLDGSAWESGDSSSRVLHGGAWHTNASECRSARRHFGDQSIPTSSFGFRIAREP
ncbi:MAG: Hercynine oxygenase [Anaerolineae bacterium]|nr:Hercynine oxygenase [Anaerolineae bacterium]